MKWIVNTPNLLKEIVENNPSAWILRTPVIIFRSILSSVAERAIKIDDPELNILMLRLGLYEVPPLEVNNFIDGQKARLEPA